MTLELVLLGADMTARATFRIDKCYLGARAGTSGSAWPLLRILLELL